MVLGSSLQVGPINEMVLSAGTGKRVIINRDPTDLDNLFTLKIRSSIGEVLSKVFQIEKE
ncbi:NAD-dependent deacetylase [compost metagenome]